MKRLNWGSSAVGAVFVAGAVVLATQTSNGSRDIMNLEHSCMYNFATTKNKSEQIVKHRATISQNVKAMIARESDKPLEVLIVLSVSKPDLSHVFGNVRKKPGTAVANRPTSFEDALAAVTNIVQKGGGEKLNVLRNAASVLVRVDRETIESLERSECVSEIVENARLEE